MYTSSVESVWLELYTVIGRKLDKNRLHRDPEGSYEGTAAVEVDVEAELS
jgi:hypothetical protein